MVIAKNPTLSVNIQFLKGNSSESDLTLLYFTGDDTYSKRDILKSLGFSFGVTHLDKAFYNVPIRSIADNTWHLLLPVSSIAAKIDLIRSYFSDITIIIN
jgi:hypothetical protein